MNNHPDKTMNKKAVLGVANMIWLFLLIAFIILIGLAAGFYIFLSAEYDFREVDASILNYKIEKCLGENELKWEADKEDFEQQFYPICNLNKKVISENNFFIYINFNDEKNYTAGKGDRTQCALSEKNPNYPVCVDSILEKNGKTIFVQTGSNQHSKKIRT